MVANASFSMPFPPIFLSRDRFDQNKTGLGVAHIGVLLSLKLGDCTVTGRVEALALHWPW